MGDEMTATIEEYERKSELAKLLKADDCEWKHDETIVWRLPNVSKALFEKRAKDGRLTAIAQIHKYKGLKAKIDNMPYPFHVVLVKPDKSLVVIGSAIKCENCDGKGQVTAKCESADCDGHQVDCCECQGSGCHLEMTEHPFNSNNVSRETLRSLMPIYHEVIGTQFTLSFEEK